MNRAIGIGKGTVSLEDITDHAELVLVVGHNPGTHHPRMLSALDTEFGIASSREHGLDAVNAIRAMRGGRRRRLRRHGRQLRQRHPRHRRHPPGAARHRADRARVDQLAFLVRPFGGLFFGPLADRIGRNKVLATTMILMALGTFAIGCIPSEKSIGIVAPMLLLAARLVQGFSTGGEYGNAPVLLGGELRARHPLIARRLRVAAEGVADEDRSHVQQRTLPAAVRHRARQPRRRSGHRNTPRCRRWRGRGRRPR